jgi:hypothetical protein
MPIKSITNHSDLEVEVLQVLATDGRAAAAAIRRKHMSEGARFAVALSTLSVGLGLFAQEAASSSGRLQPQAYAEEAPKLVSRYVTPAFQGLRDDIQTAKRSGGERIARINEPPAQLPFATEDRAAFRALDLAAKAAWIIAADRWQLAALIVAGRIRSPELSDELWNEIIERHAILAHIERSGLQAGFQLQPTPADPAITGPDVQAAEAAAREAVARWRDDEQAVEDAENTLRSVIGAIAVATDMTVDDAFRLLNGDAA